MPSHKAIVTELFTLLISLDGINWPSFARVLEALADIGEHSKDPLLLKTSHAIVSVLLSGESTGPFRVIDTYAPQAIGPAPSGSLTYTLTGHVTGVGMRYFVQSAANALGISGYIRNLPSGDVRIVVFHAADLPPTTLDRFASILHTGPEGSRIVSLTFKGAA